MKTSGLSANLPPSLQKEVVQLADKKQQSKPTAADKAATVSAHSQGRAQAKVTLDQQTASFRLAQIAHKYGITSQVKGQLSLEQRASRRERLDSARKQQNLEMIMQQALSYVDDKVPNEDIDPDWLHQFFEMAESIFSTPMQKLWGKILAMQTLRPGSFSLRALSTLKQMTHRDALIFQAACNVTLKDKNEYGGRIFSGFYVLPTWFDLFKKDHGFAINLSKCGLNYPDLLTLFDLNLLYASEIETTELKKGQVIEMEIGSGKIQLQVAKSGYVLTYYKLTQIGNELARLIPAELNLNYLEQFAAVLEPAIHVNMK
ncbi:TIGR03899 family protein [Catenovulum agarivorans]|uniref:TIGR03899 family protein n=1 Tax=Catenovulum agarivorans TaxID=1172192 RepID=UPI000306D6BF|nr:TIGR03899 family protein [Catenovulum agarivorans]